MLTAWPRPLNGGLHPYLSVRAGKPCSTLRPDGTSAADMPRPDRLGRRPGKEQADHRIQPIHQSLGTGEAIAPDLEPCEAKSDCRSRESIRQFQKRVAVGEEEE